MDYLKKFGQSVLSVMSDDGGGDNSNNAYTEEGQNSRIKLPDEQTSAQRRNQTPILREKHAASSSLSSSASSSSSGEEDPSAHDNKKKKSNGKTPEKNNTNAPSIATTNTTFVAPNATVPGADLLSLDGIEIYQLDPNDLSYFVVTPAQCIFLMKRVPTAPLNNHSTNGKHVSQLASVEGLISSDKIYELIHSRQPIVRPVPDGNLSLSLVAIFEYQLLSAELNHTLTAILMESRMAMTMTSLPATTFVRDQTRIEELLPAPMPDPIKSMPVTVSNGSVLVNRSAKAGATRNSTTKASSSSHSGDKNEPADLASAKTKQTKRKIQRTKKLEQERREMEERRKAMAASSSSNNGYELLPETKKRKVITMLQQRRGGVNRVQSSTIGAVNTHQRYANQQRERRALRNDEEMQDLSGSSYSDDDDDDDSSSYSSEDEEGSSHSSNNEAEYGPKRMKRRDTKSPPQKPLLERTLDRWKCLFRLDDPMELKYWLLKQLNNWVEVDAVAASFFGRTDTLSKGNTLTSLLQQLHPLPWTPPSSTAIISTTPNPWDDSDLISFNVIADDDTLLEQ
jgi:hypothetical protein